MSVQRQRRHDNIEDRSCRYSTAENDHVPRCRATNSNLSSDGTRTYTFDAADRLKTITQGATTVTFAYDGLGRRLKQTVGATETRYLWCGTTICQIRSAADAWTHRLYPEGEYRATGTKKYLYLTDHLGSVRDVIDITGTPTLVGSFDYRPYGEVARSWGTVTTGYTYAGLFAQTNTGLLLSTTRAYNPANGKWLNVDPIREAGGVNLTGYVGGSPMMGVDPMGLTSGDVCLADSNSRCYTECMEDYACWCNQSPSSSQKTCAEVNKGACTAKCKGQENEPYIPTDGKYWCEPKEGKCATDPTQCKSVNLPGGGGVSLLAASFLTSNAPSPGLPRLPNEITLPMLQVNLWVVHVRSNVP